MGKEESFLKLQNKFEELSSFSDDTQRPACKVNFQVALAPYIGQASSFYDSQSSLKRITIPNDKVGLVIRRKAKTKNHLQNMSGAKIQVIDDLYADPSSKTRDVILCGRPEHIRKAANLINHIVKEDIAALYCKNTNKNISHSAPSCGIESFALVDGFKVKLKYHDLFLAAANSTDRLISLSFFSIHLPSRIPR
ncbi:hypothetical protein ACHQM5_015026 [Ranunculus cassubicifolius]